MHLLFTLAAFFLALGILVAVHEWGHYRMALACGVRVLRFSIGFGPTLLAWRPKKQKRGQSTEFALSLIPLGGYVRMLDKRDTSQTIAPEDMAYEFTSQAAWRRFLIVAAGPCANLLLAVALYAGMAWWGLPQLAPVLGTPPAQSAAALAGLRGGERVLHMRRTGQASNQTPQSLEDVRWQALQATLDHQNLQLQLADGRQVVLPLSTIPTTGELNTQFMDRIGIGRPWLTPSIAHVLPQGRAAQAGVQAGDRVLRINDQPIADGIALMDAIEAGASAQGSAAQVWQVERHGSTLSLTLHPHAVNLGSVETPAWVSRVDVFLASPEFATVRLGPWAGLRAGFTHAWDYAALSVQMLWRMATGQSSPKNLSGSFTIADLAGRSASLGLLPFIGFLAAISISLGVVNLLPVPLPALDGGYLVHYAVEMITGKTVSEPVFLALQKLGIGMILAMMLIAHWNDLHRYFPQWFAPLWP